MQLRKGTKDVAPALIQVLQDGNFRVCAVEKYILGTPEVIKTGGNDMLPLIKVMQDRNEEVRARVIETLEKNSLWKPPRISTPKCRSGLCCQVCK